MTSGLEEETRLRDHMSVGLIPTSRSLRVLRDRTTHVDLLPRCDRELDKWGARRFCKNDPTKTCLTGQLDADFSICIFVENRNIVHRSTGLRG